MIRYCFAMIAMIGLSGSASLYAEDAGKSPKPTVTFTQSQDGDVLFEVMGDARYIVSDFAIYEEFDRDKGKPTGRCSFDFSLYRPKPYHHTYQTVTDVKSVTLKNVDCTIDKRDAKTFRSTFFQKSPFKGVTLKFVLLEGPDAPWGRNQD